MLTSVFPVISFHLEAKIALVQPAQVSQARVQAEERFRTGSRSRMGHLVDLI